MSKLRHRSDFVIANQRAARPADRRAWPRFASVGVRCWMGWWPEGKPRVEQAVVLDVGQGGAAVVSRVAPRRGNLIWIRPVSAMNIGWIEGTVARISGPGWLGVLLGQPAEIGIRFHEVCAWEALRAALFGEEGPTTPELQPPTLPGPGRTGP
ncbi:hypothetical protein [Tautonia sociabilis]|uniref:PilZ domain-containing protein n=1 Tax=Tautonia sociabilis TaxID=2080755 RepID=A0A432MJP8_9BACT|nr:hypothetical protein [Tautonia sociabilis]RUL87346.1 hypothetical protein TsocGM_12495 [Tautonia sociabilis]